MNFARVSTSVSDTGRNPSSSSAAVAISCSFRRGSELGYLISQYAQTAIHDRLPRMRTLLALILVFGAGDDEEVVRPLEAKGVKTKKKGGVVVELNMGPLKGITPDDYKAVGRCRSLVALTLNAEDQKFNDEAAAQLTGLDKLER